MRIKFIKEIVRRLKYVYDTKCPIEIIKLKNINLTFLPNDTECHDLQGMYFKCSSDKFIFINPNLSDELRRVTYAHELGHAILHDSVNAFSLNSTYFCDRLEREADIFACEMLLDDDIFDEYYGFSDEYIAKCEGVTVEMVRLKFKNMDKSKIKYDECCFLY